MNVLTVSFLIPLPFVSGVRAVMFRLLLVGPPEEAKIIARIDVRGVLQWGS
jgi:hypothetical protein